LYLSSLIYISFGAGFFNFIAWFILMGLGVKSYDIHKQNL
jgi:hypothetical protein